MITKLRYQLNTIREILGERRETPSEIGDTLNDLREAILGLIDPEEAKVMQNLIKPINNGNSSYMQSSVGLMRCDQLISILPELEKRENDQGIIERIIPNSKKVFIIHGQDKTNLLSLRSLLIERFGLNPIILNEQASKGRTLIEKFEQEALSAAFAFALFTPDDEIGTQTFQYHQARPNVIFEIGWFFSRLGRNRVAILFKSGTKIHSDLDGIVRIEFEDSINERILEIERELIASEMINIR